MTRAAATLASGGARSNPRTRARLGAPGGITLMKTSASVTRLGVVLGAVIALLLPGTPAWSGTAIGTAFTYQGSLNDGGAAPTAPYDFRFTLYDAAIGGNTVSGSIELGDISVVSGIFTVELDFGVVPFSVAEAKWLLIEIRPGASTGAYTPLPRQKLNPTPTALGLSLPHSQVTNSASTLFSMFNSGSGYAGEFGSSAGMYGLVGRTSSTAFQASGIFGEGLGASGNTIGVRGVATVSPNGTGLVGVGSATGAYIVGSGPASTGVYAFGQSRGLYAENTATGPAIVARGAGVDTANATMSAANVGQGTAIYAIGNGPTRTRATLRLNNTHADGQCEYAINTSTQSTAHFQNDGSGQVLWLQKDSPGNFIQAFGSGETKFWVDQAGVTHTKVLEILGGSDLSERFDVASDDQAIEPGTVVSIDPAHEGRLVTSREPYDHRVAGIISGAGGVSPGMLMGQKGSVADGARPVALTGRVYCRATTANGAIRPGDLLTTSSIPGHAMRVENPARAQGAILGKAMGSLERGEGLVLVLVGLQ